MSGEKQPPAGREYVRRKYVCESCGVARAIGTAKPGSTWPSHLRLMERQVKWMTTAAAEYEALCEESDTISSSVDFVDWLALCVSMRDVA